MQTENIAKAGADVTQQNATRLAERAASARTALVLALVAVVFFAAIILTQLSAASLIGLGAMGIALVAFLLVVRAARVKP